MTKLEIRTSPVGCGTVGKYAVLVLATIWFYGFKRFSGGVTQIDFYNP